MRRVVYLPILLTAQQPSTKTVAMIKDTIFDLTPECYEPFSSMEQQGIADANRLEREFAKNNVLTPLWSGSTKVSGSQYGLQLDIPIPDMVHAFEHPHTVTALSIASAHKVRRMNISALGLIVSCNICRCECEVWSTIFAIRRYTLAHPELFTVLSYQMALPHGKIKPAALHAWFAENEEAIGDNSNWAAL